MKTIMKPVDMLAWFDEQGTPHPIRFRIKSAESEDMIIRIERIMFKQRQKSGGNIMMRFDCRAHDGRMPREVQINYETASCKWYLMKM